MIMLEMNTYKIEDENTSCLKLINLAVKLQNVSLSRQIISTLNSRTPFFFFIHTTKHRETWPI